MKISVLDLAAILGKIFKTSVSETEKACFPLHETPGKKTIKAMPLTSSVSSLSNRRDALSSRSNFTAKSPMAVKLSQIPTVGSKTAELSASPCTQITVDANPYDSRLDASKRPAAFIRSKGPNSGRPWPGAVQAFPWKTQSEVQPLMGQDCIPHQWNDYSKKKQLTREVPAHSYPDRHCTDLSQFTKSVVVSIGSYHSICSASRLPGNSRATPLSHHTSCSGIPSGTTGLSTEQSSVYSWRDDEFDRVNTQRVCQLFCDVDEMLYEGKVSSRTQGLRKECQEWTGHSPHLRILGNQMESPRHQGFQYFHVRASSARSSPSLPALDNGEVTRELRVEGHRLVPTPCILHTGSESRHPPSNNVMCPTLTEEVYETEGQIEELLAYDVKETDDEGVDRRKASVTGRRGVPPVSPHACIKDAVAGALFDDVWSTVVRMLEDLLHKQVPGSAAQLGTSDTSRPLSNPSFHVQIKDPSVPDNRSTSSRPNVTPTLAARVSSALKSNLNGVMTIQTKPLQRRHPGSSEKSQGGALILTDRAQGRMRELSSISSSSRATCSLSHRALPQRRLLRLGAETRLCPAVYSHKAPRGTKLSTVAEGLIFPPSSPVRRQRFPPIGSANVEHILSLPAQRSTQPRGRALHGRVASALHPRSNLLTLTDRTDPLPESPSRPNTMHTFRWDTPMKMSFTPGDFACHMRTGRGSFTGQCSAIGVTGFSVGTACSITGSLSECCVEQKTWPNRCTREVVERQGSHQRKAVGRIAPHSKKKLQMVSS